MDKCTQALYNTCNSSLEGGGGQFCEYSYSPAVMQQRVTGSQKSGADFFVLKKFIDFVLLTSHQKHRLKKNCS
jgi:hypothetical protein